MTHALFDNCTLTRSTFDQTILEHADLRTSHDYSIDPERNRVKRAQFSILGVAGLLEKYQIETEYFKE